MEKITKVVGAVIFDPQTDSFFIGQRSRLKKHPLKWEFIGGKIEDEDLGNLLRATEREFEEDVRQQIKALKLLDSMRYDYEGEVGTVEINFVECERFVGKPQFDRSVYETCEWVPKNRLASLDWIEADKDFAKKLASQY